MARQALERDEGWVRLARRRLSALPAPTATVSPVAAGRRRAFDAASDGDYTAAAEHMSAAVAASDGDREKGWLLEEQAAYIDHVDPERAQRVLASARTKNTSVLRPLSGVGYQRLSASGEQAQRAADHLTGPYGDGVALRLSFEAVLDDLAFDPDRTEEFEEAMRRIGEHLGLVAQRPEREIGSGPDVLWGLGASSFWVIEAKTGAISNLIHKRDANQLSGSVNWFRDRYDAASRVVPVMVHPARQLARDATATPGMRVLDEDGLDRLKTAVRAFAGAVAASRWDDAGHLDGLLRGHRLRSSDLASYLRDHRPAR